MNFDESTSVLELDRIGQKIQENLLKPSLVKYKLRAVELY